MNFEIHLTPCKTSSLERYSANIERQWLNPLGYIPVASSFSGGFRSMLGVIQMIAGAILLGVSFLEMLADPRGHEETRQSGCRYLIHGAANFLRAKVEIIMFVGNLTCYLYDSSTPRLSYPFEKGSVFI